MNTIDIEVKTLSTRKSGKEGSTVDVLCDSIFQLIVGMQLHISSETQEKDIQELLSLLPKTSHDYSSPLAPKVAFDRGYGKMSEILFFLERQFKIITVCAAVGSGHPFVSQSDIKAYIDPNRNLTIPSRYLIFLKSLNKTFTKVKEAINQNGTKLKDFVFRLGLVLIRSANERIHFMDKITQPRLDGSIIDYRCNVSVTI